MEAAIDFAFGDNGDQIPAARREPFLALCGRAEAAVSEDAEANNRAGSAGFDADARSCFRRTQPAEKEGRGGAFSAPGDAATLPELIRFLIDRTGYIKALEAEASPESFSRIENLKELANAAHDAEERGETLAEFLDHAALASDTDQYDPESRVTLMSLHAAKGSSFRSSFLPDWKRDSSPIRARC